MKKLYYLFTEDGKSWKDGIQLLYSMRLSHECKWAGCKPFLTLVNNTEDLILWFSLYLTYVKMTFEGMLSKRNVSGMKTTGWGVVCWSKISLNSRSTKSWAPSEGLMTCRLFPKAQKNPKNVIVLKTPRNVINHFG